MSDILDALRKPPLKNMCNVALVDGDVVESAIAEIKQLRAALQKCREATLEECAGVARVGAGYKPEACCNRTALEVEKAIRELQEKSGE